MTINLLMIKGNKLKTNGGWKRGEDLTTFRFLSISVVFLGISVGFLCISVVFLSISVGALQETLRKRRNLEKPIEDHRRVNVWDNMCKNNHFMSLF